jgi:choline dehydrogenase-like flavoprotein
MLDAGLTLEARRAERVAAMSSLASDQWSADDLAFIREGTTASKSGIPLKRLYGSDVAFRDAEDRLGLELSGVGIKASIARGGFSNVWGAAVLPYQDVDMAGWPFGAERLSEHYRAVARLMGVAAVHDDLATRFPLYTEEPASLQLSAQARQMMSRLERNREQLAQAGWLVGQSRLAVAGGEGSRNCVYCGLCMYGCPYGLIYNSSSTLDQLRQHPRFRYRAGVVVDAVSEGSTAITINGHDLETGERLTIEAARAYLATGVISSAQIVLRSLSAYDRPISIMDSQYFLVPLLTGSAPRGVESERAHTLSQLFLELYDPAISAFGVHLQVYTYNDLMGQAIRTAFGPLSALLEPLARGLEHRMLVIQGYLHSAHSGMIRAELKRTVKGDRLLVQGVQRDDTRRIVKRVLRKLAAHAGHFGAIPLMPLAKIADPGRGFHTGGSFPMKQRPTAFETDVLGRPAGWHRLHLVDSSILPSVPASTITFPVMANAHRIGSESDLM